MANTRTPVGPEFLNTKQSQEALDNLVTSAEHRLVLVTAFVDFRKAANFWRAVGRATERGADVTLHARDDESVIRHEVAHRNNKRTRNGSQLGDEEFAHTSRASVLFVTAEP